MADKEHLDILKRGVAAWNTWREQNPLTEPYLVGANLTKWRLAGIDFKNADLSYASLTEAELGTADLSNANLTNANLSQADLRSAILEDAKLNGAEFTGANLYRAELNWADLTDANLSSANLKEAYLDYARLVETNFEDADLTGCRVFGVSAWGLKLSGAIQSNLIISPMDEPTIMVDNLEVAQFIYLLLHNEKLRDVIDTITSKVVLILGRFTPERKAVLDAIREELRKFGYCPVLFDFEKPRSRDFTETVHTLAHMARFIIADITDAKSIPQELQAIVPTLAVPIQPLLEDSASAYGMFSDLKKYQWVLEEYRYKSLADLLASLESKVIAPAEAKAKELERR